MFNFPPTRSDVIVACRDPPHTSRFFVGDKKSGVSRQKSAGVIFEGLFIYQIRMPNYASPAFKKALNIHTCCYQFFLNDKPPALWLQLEYGQFDWPALKSCVVLGNPPLSIQRSPSRLAQGQKRPRSKATSLPASFRFGRSLDDLLQFLRYCLSQYLQQSVLIRIIPSFF